MEDLKHKYENFRKCCDALGKAIELQEQLESTMAGNTIAQDLFTAGVIKHFELTYETGWKFLKTYLNIKYDYRESSPKAIFRACGDYLILPQVMVNELITLADARNETTHIYNRLLAQEVCDSIEKHYQVFGKILEIIKLPLD